MGYQYVQCTVIKSKERGCEILLTHSEHLRGVPAVKTGRKVWDTFDKRYFQEILEIILRVKRVYLNKIKFNLIYIFIQ